NLNAAFLQGRSIASTAPTSGQILGWNALSNQWQPVNQTVAGITDLTGDVSATGPGSAVATIANNAITTAKIKNSGGGVNRLLMTDASTGGTIGFAACVTGEVLKYDNTTGWGCAADVGASGMVTGVIAGTGMVPATITSVGTLNIDVGITGN